MQKERGMEGRASFEGGKVVCLHFSKLGPSRDLRNMLGQSECSIEVSIVSLPYIH
jgi:hypothetical protein